MVHHCITPFNVNSLCLNSILIHLYTNIKVNNDWEANHMQALYINFPLIVGVFIGGVGIKHLVRIANTTSLLLLEWGSFLTIINWVYLCDCHIQSVSFSFSPISITYIYLSKYRIISNSYLNNNCYSYALYVCSQFTRIHLSFSSLL